jgi:hypothetical protein
MDHVASRASEEQEAQRLLFGSEAMRAWFLANAVAFAIGAAVAGGVLRVLGQPYYGNVDSAMEAARIQSVITSSGAATFGLVLGVAQWLALRRVLGAGWWAPLTFVGWTLAGVVAGFNAGGSLSTIGPDSPPIPPLLYTPVALILVVLFLGAGQGRILRRVAEEARWWPVVNFAALVAGLVAGFAIAQMAPWLAPTDFPSPGALLVVGAVAGPVYGMLTGVFLSELHRRSA